MLRAILVPLAVALLLVVVPVSAQTQYTQPLYPIAWGSIRTITVAVPSQPSWAYNLIMTAATTWNQAQQWFVESYYPKQVSAVFTLQVIAGSEGMTTVEYAQTNTIPCGSIQATGCTSNQGHLIVLSAAFFGLNMDARTEVVMHELGHILGLGDNLVQGDLMLGSETWNGNNLNPSTLDLYAVFVVAETGYARSGSSITLPSSIPYGFWGYGMQPIPEFQDDLLPALCSTLLLVAVLTKVRVKDSPKLSDGKQRAEESVDDSNSECKTERM